MHHLLSGLGQNPAFTDTDAAYAVVDDGLVIRAANDPYLRATGRTREELVGVPVFEAFPNPPDDPQATGVATLTASYELVFREGRRDRLALQRYDIPAPGSGGGFVQKYWDPVNSPLRDERGRTIAALHHAEDVTSVIGPILAAVAKPPPGIVAESFVWNQLVQTLMAETLAHTETRLERDQLRHALESRVVIEQAKGVLMVRLQCSVEEAFAELRRRSRSTQRRIHDVAREVVRDAHPA